MTIHDDIQAALGDYLSGELDTATRDDVRTHLDVCPECRAELESVRELLGRVGELPRETEPARDLWNGIAARIADPTSADSKGAAVPTGVGARGASALSVGDRVRGFLRAFLAPGPGPVLAGVTAVAAVLIGVVFWVGRDPGPNGDVSTNGSTGAPAESAGESAGEMAIGGGAPELASDETRPETSRFVSSLVQALEFECMGAGKELYAAASTGDMVFGPEVDQALQSDVRMLDDAIDETLAALEADPDDAQLLQMLTQRYQQKLALLHRAIRLAEVA